MVHRFLAAGGAPHPGCCKEQIPCFALLELQGGGRRDWIKNLKNSAATGSSLFGGEPTFGSIASMSRYACSARRRYSAVHFFDCWWALFGACPYSEYRANFVNIYCLLELNMLCDCVTRGCGDHSPLTTAAILQFFDCWWALFGNRAAGKQQ